MSNITLLCRTATTFSKEGELDEDAFRAFLQRFVDAKLGIYLASGGSGEGHALSRDEIRRIYAIGVEVGKGKIQVSANLPEQHTPKATIEHAEIAISAGIDVVNIYGPTSWHGFRPTESELVAYFDEVLSTVKHDVALAPNPVIGYTPPASLVASLCRRYHNVVAVNLSGLNDSYFIDLKDALTTHVEIYVPFVSSSYMLDLGATGLLAAHANIIPKTFRRYIDLYEVRDFETLALVYADLIRFKQYVSAWDRASPRWLKMAMRVLGLPGGEGTVRAPYLMPPAAELQTFTRGLLQLHIPEIDELAIAAGLSVPA